MNPYAAGAAPVDSSGYVAALLGIHEGLTGTAVHGLGTISTQNANSVNISGGSISGVSGVVSSVAVTGANGIGVSGSPVTSSGTIGLSLGAITPTSVAATGAVSGTSITDSGLTSGRIPYASTGGLLADSSALLWDNSLIKLSVNGIGISRGLANTESNTAVGNAALVSTTTGGLNTAVGFAALTQTQGGQQNTAIGHTALRNNITGIANVAIGYVALFTNTGGNYNMAVGHNALYYNTASNNTAVGDGALVYNSSGSNNVGIGSLAGYGSGVNYNTTGIQNTFIGADTVGAASGDNNCIAIGYGAVGLGSNTTVIGNSSTTITCLRGSVIVGTTASTTIGNANKLQVAGTTAATNSLGISAWSADALGSRIELGKSRGAAIGTNTIVQDGDVVGSLLGYGANGSTFTNAASISLEIDGTPGASNDMPGRVVIKTTPNGSGTLTEAARFDNAQNTILIGSIKTAAPTTGTAAAWKLGSNITGQIGLTLDTTKYVELDVGGTFIKVATVA